MTVTFGQKGREELAEKYKNGNKKLLVKYQGAGSDEVVVEKISYSEKGDTLILEKPLDKLKMMRNYYENGPLKEEKNYKDEKLDGKWITFFENSQIIIEKNFKDGLIFEFLNG